MASKSPLQVMTEAGLDSNTIRALGRLTPAQRLAYSNQASREAGGGYADQSNLSRAAKRRLAATKKVDSIQEDQRKAKGSVLSQLTKAGLSSDQIRALGKARPAIIESQRGAAKSKSMAAAAARRRNRGTAEKFADKKRNNFLQRHAPSFVRTIANSADRAVNYVGRELGPEHPKKR